MFYTRNATLLDCACYAVDMTEPDPSNERHLRRAGNIAHLLDSAFTIPGTRKTIGLDPLIGLIPVAGDVVTGLFSLYLLWTAYKLGKPPKILWAMLANVLIDLFVGAIPILGDVFDFVFKANRRNLKLLENDRGED